MARNGVQSWKPMRFFVIDLILVALLMLGALAFATGAIPQLGPRRPAFLVIVPYWVPWAGVLGGVCISLVGVSGHAGAWDANTFALWHLARPLLGGIFGTVSVLIVILFLKNVTVVDDKTPLTPQGTAVLTVIAFVVGFREETFRTLVRRVVDVLLGPGNADAVSVVAFVPAVLDFGTPTEAGLPSQERTVHLFNGSPDTLHITAASIVCEDPSLTVGDVADTDLKPASSLALTVKWAPTATGPLSSFVSVSAASRTVRLQVIGNIAT